MKPLSVLSLPFLALALASGLQAQTWTATNPADFGDANNDNLQAIAYGGFLYATTDNGATGVQVRRWSGEGAYTTSAPNGFGDASNDAVTSLALFAGDLFVATDNGATGTEVWRHDGATWAQANLDSFGSGFTFDGELFPLGSTLYAAVRVPGSGAEVWRYDSGTTWVRIGVNGFGSAANYDVADLVVWNSDLYAGTGNFSTGCEVLRYVSGTNWVRVDPGAPGPGNGGFDASGQDNEWASLYVFGNVLYAGTENVVTGTEPWRYDGGTSWTQVGPNGLGNFANQDIEEAFPFGGSLYLGTINFSTGNEVWRFDGGTSFTKVSSGAIEAATNLAILDFEEWGGVLHATTASFSGAEVHRYDGGTTWTRIDPGAPGPGNGGFGDTSNAFAELLEFGGLLHAVLPDIVWRLEPGTFYCTGKTSSVGCVPFLTTTGFPSATATTPFQIVANDVVPNESGFIIYAFKKANLNFHGGKLCVKSPFVRTPAKTPKNPGGGCSGWVLRRNFNATIQSGLDPSLTAGRVVTAQWRQRDPADPAGFGDALTDGLRFTILP